MALNQSPLSNELRSRDLERSRSEPAWESEGPCERVAVAMASTCIRARSAAPVVATATRPHTTLTPKITWEIRTGPANPVDYRRLLGILCSPDTETVALNGLRIRVA